MNVCGYSEHTIYMNSTETEELRHAEQSVGFCQFLMTFENQRVIF